jgi:PEP-CTERM motif-containing protein
LTAGDTLNSAEVSFTSEPNGGTLYFDQVVSFFASGCTINSYGYDVCDETGTFNGPTLNNGTYWVNLQNAVDSGGNPVYWDENSGIGCHSEGCPSQACEAGCLGTMPSEAFSILGSSSASTGSVPEPNSLLLFGSGFFGVIALLRRKLF